jgi:hypothetical protein
MLRHEEWKSVIKHGDSCTKGLVWVGENILTLLLTGEGTKLQQYNYYMFAVNSQAKVAHKPNKLVCACMLTCETFADHWRASLEIELTWWRRVCRIADDCLLRGHLTTSR